MDAVLVDTGVWYAIFDHRDPNHPHAADKAELLGILSIVVPWPTMYETLRTRFVHNRFALAQFELVLKMPNVVFIEDGPFRDAAFDLSLDSSLRRSRPLSMVDCLLRLVIDDARTSIQYLATYNRRDFVDVCASNRVEII